VIFADEVYDKVLYDGVKHTAIGSLSTTCSRSPSTRCPRATVPAATAPAGCGVGRQEGRADYIEGLTMLSNMRLCANVPGQWAIQTALGGYQSINDLMCPAGGCAASATSPTSSSPPSRA
jgi:alanine-synthesizing transaminase